MSGKKRIVALISLLIFLGAGCFGVVYMASTPNTYSGDADVTELYANPSDYDVSDADGISSIIVKETLQKTNAVNTVSAVVFDFRGYDTMGESFILLTAITGSMAIIRKGKKGGKSKNEEKH